MRKPCKKLRQKANAYLFRNTVPVAKGSTQPSVCRRKQNPSVVTGIWIGLRNGSWLVVGRITHPPPCSFPRSQVARSCLLPRSVPCISVNCWDIQFTGGFRSSATVSITATRSCVDQLSALEQLQHSQLQGFVGSETSRGQVQCKTIAPPPVRSYCEYLDE